MPTSLANRTNKSAMCSRMTGRSGENVVAEVPLVIP